MASALEQQIRIVFQGQDRTSTAIRSATKNLGQLEGATKSLAAPLASMGATALKAEAALIAVGTAAGVYALYKFSEFQTATTGLAKVLGTAGPEADALGNSMIKMSNATGVSSSILIDTATEWKRAGFELGELNQLTDDSVKFFTAAGEAEFDMGMATSSLIKIMKGYNLEASEATEIGDTLSFVANNNATSVGMLSEAMARASASGRIAGLSYKELVSYMTPTIEVFQNGQIAGTAWNALLQRMISDTAPVKEGFKQLGLSQREHNGELKNGSVLLKEVSGAFRDLADSEKAEVAMKIGGIKQSAKLLTTLANQTAQIKILDETTRASGNMFREYGIRMRDMEKQVDRVGVSFNNFLLLIGGKFAPVATELLKSTGEIGSALQTMVSSDTFDPIFREIVAFGDGLADNLSAIAEIIPEAFANVNFDELMGAFSSLGEEIGKTFDGVDLTTITGLTSAIQTVVDIATGVTNVVAGMVQSFKPFFESIYQGIIQIKNLDSDTQKAFGNILASAQLIMGLGVKVAAVFFTMQQAGTDMGSTVAIVVGGIRLVVNGLQIVFDSLASFVVGTFELIVDNFGTLRNTVGTVIPGLGIAMDMVSSKTDGFKKSIEGMNDAIKQDQQDQFADIDDAIKKMNMSLSAPVAKTKELNENIDDLSGDAIDETDKSLKDFVLDAQVAATEIDTLSTATSEPKPVKIEVDTTEVGPAAVYIEQQLPTGEKRYTNIGIRVNAEDMAKGKAEIKKAVPKDQTIKLKLETDLQLAKMKHQSDTMQAMLEFDAKIKMARIESSTKKMVAQAKMVSDAFKSTGDVINKTLSLKAGGDLNQLEQYKLDSVLRDEMSMRKEMFELQKQMLEATIKTENLKAERLVDGEFEIKVTADDIRPHAEAILLAVVKTARIKASAEGLNQLLGI